MGTSTSRRQAAARTHLVDFDLKPQKAEERNGDNDKKRRKTFHGCKNQENALLAAANK
ncbi:hypothetical protein E4U54_005978, partial [Claviceps lovelessii]